MVGGGLATVGGILFAFKRSSDTKENVEKAVGAGGKVAIHATGYWPFQKGLSVTERKMEGGTTDRKGNPLHTLEMHQKDPVNHPFVSVAGDYEIWPYGQKISLSPWPNSVFRVVDTGGHFHGVNKVFRVVGEEPLDIAVDSSTTIVPKKGVIATIFPGDNFEKGKLVATSKFKDQTVAGEVREGRTVEDREALARAIESELGGRPLEEQEAAAWSMRNRADETGMALYTMLCPKDEYGSPQKSGGYASTRKTPTDKSREIASAVLDAPYNADPTQGAVEFWLPSQQQKMRELGDIYRAAANSGDTAKAKQYARYAGYGNEGDVRVQQMREGLRVLRVVGVVELLGRLS
jgi:hypothetical protein